MNLSGRQKKYLKKHLKKKTPKEIALYLGIQEKEIETYLKNRWGQKKYQKFLSFQKRENKNNYQGNSEQKILSFNFRAFFKKNITALIILALAVLLVYFNSFNAEFVSDDVGGILKSKFIEDPRYIIANVPTVTQQLTFFVIHKIFGSVPIYYRLVNIIFHLGTVLITYLLLSLLLNPLVGFLSGLLMAVHPFEVESVTWISGGAYPKYSFFLLLSLLFFILVKKNKKYYFWMLISFLLGLMTSEKAMVFPVILLAFCFAFGQLKKNWRLLIIPGIITIFWFLIYALKIPVRMSELQTGAIPQTQNLNPLIQIPVAISSYLELIFWPQKLTLYHTEMSFNFWQYTSRLITTILFFGLIVLGFRKSKQIFFWLSFFIISLLPTLTPLGVSWIVAERYAYLGSIGLFVCLAIVIEKLSKIKNLKTPIYIIFSFIIIALFIRTVVRNNDWKNEDNLWIASAKTSPSSSQNHNNLGDYYGRHGELDKAVAEFKLAIELRPGYADAYHNLGNVYVQKGDTQQAIINFQKALEYNPNLWQSDQNLASIYFTSGDYQKAQEYMQKAISVNSQEANLHLNLALVLIKLGNKQEAQKEIDLAKNLDPQNPQLEQIKLAP